MLSHVTLLMLSLVFTTVAGAFAPASAAQSIRAIASTPLIPRDVLFGNPDRAALRISPDGKHLSFLAPVNGVLNVWVAPVEDIGAAKPVTKDTGRGANDPRVKQTEADQIVAAMQRRGIPATYVLYPDEGHGFARPENRQSFNAVVEAFLGRHLGGRVEPVGRHFEGSTITVPTGAGEVPGLQATLTRR